MQQVIRYWSNKDEFYGGEDDGIVFWANAYEATFGTALEIDDFIKSLQDSGYYAYELGVADDEDEYAANIDWSGEIVYLTRPTRYIPGSPDHKIICKYLLQNEDIILDTGYCQVYSEYIVFEHLGTPYLQLTLDLQYDGKNFIGVDVGIATPLDEATQYYRINENPDETYVNQYMTTFKMRQFQKKHLRLNPDIIDEIAKAIEESISV